MSDGACRVAHCIHGLGLGGAQKVIASLVRNRRAGFRHFVFSCHGGVLRDDVETAGAVVRIVERKLPKLDPAWIGALARAMAADRIDVVHTHLFGDSLHGYLAARRAGLPVVTTLHNVYGSFSSLQRLGYRWLLRRGPRAVACSESVRRSFRDARVRAAGGLITIANGIEEPPGTVPDEGERRRLRAELGIRPEAVLFATVGRLVEQKGYRYLLSAFARLPPGDGPEARLLMLGDGPQRAELEGLARRLGLGDRVRFAGFRPDVPGLLPAIDAVVFSSIYEGLPVALLEAMAAGKPILSTDVPSLLEALRHDREALVVPVRQVEPLRAALARLIAEPELRARLGEGARGRFLESYTAERMVRSYEALYRDPLAQVAA